MIKPYKLTPQLTRCSTFFDINDERVPKELFEIDVKAPNMDGYNFPLPSKKEDYTCFALGDDGVVWLGAKTGITRYAPNALRKDDIVMYFSADRDLISNNVKTLLAEGNNVWALCDNSVAYIEMKKVSTREKADILLDETLKYVERRGMVSQRGLKKARDFESRYPYAHSDNDGTFTACFALGEIFHYAVLKRERGENDPETKRIKAVAVRATEACLLLMNIAGRGNGFVARTYHTPDEPVPDEGLFYRKEGDKAICLKTSGADDRDLVGFEVPVVEKVPDRLAKLYRDLGYCDDGIVYKGDTSSDEITHHYLLMYFAHKILCDDDPELKDLIEMSAKNTLKHIVDNGLMLMECDGEPTTWAKWNKEYFEMPFGYVDACLNSAEIMMYLRVVMDITGEKGIWQKTYDDLIAYGYADLPRQHYERLSKSCEADGIEPAEDIMYGDHMLATISFWLLITLEPDETLKEKLREGFRSWNSSLRPEHNPGYDFPYALACPNDEIDMEAIATWFYRTNLSRLAAGVSLIGRQDVNVITLKGGYKVIDRLLPPDERFISKYDRDPLEYKNEDSGGVYCIESCYVYTLAYWMGIYYGFIEE